VAKNVALSQIDNFEAVKSALAEGAVERCFPKMRWRFSGMDSARYYPQTNKLVMAAAPDPFLFICGWPEVDVTVHSITVILIHELAHWAGEAHKSDGWEWNINIERIMLGLPVRRRMRG
jgi:hypothetical protein